MNDRDLALVKLVSGSEINGRTVARIAFEAVDDALIIVFTDGTFCVIEPHYAPYGDGDLEIRFSKKPSVYALRDAAIISEETLQKILAEEKEERYNAQMARDIATYEKLKKRFGDE